MFRPCIDLHEGKVKQIVGGSLGKASVLRLQQFDAVGQAVKIGINNQQRILSGNHGGGNGGVEKSHHFSRPAKFRVQGGQLRGVRLAKRINETAKFIFVKPPRAFAQMRFDGWMRAHKEFRRDVSWNVKEAVMRGDERFQSANFFQRRSERWYQSRPA
jgi:hypothetical protein